MAKNQKKYTQEFKQQIVDLYNTGNYSFPQLSSEYGVAKSTILNWVRNLSPIQVSETETISMKEYKALQKKMKELVCIAPKSAHTRCCTFCIFFCISLFILLLSQKMHTHAGHKKEQTLH